MSDNVELIGFAGLARLASTIPDDVARPQGAGPAAPAKPPVQGKQAEATPATENGKSTVAVERNPNSGWSPESLTFVAIIAVIIGAIWLTSVPRPGSYTQSPPSTPSPSSRTTQNPPERYPPQPPLNRDSGPGSSQRDAPSRPPEPRTPPISSQTTEALAPAPGDGTRIFSQQNVRWCQQQSQRLDIIKTILGSTASDQDVQSFNILVNDYNGRCGRYRYQESDLAVVRSEMINKASEFRADAEKIIREWPHRRYVPPPLPPTPAYTPPQSPTTSQPEIGQIPPPRDVVVAVPSPPDLLVLDEATAIQRRLASLGYYYGEPNGIWGSRSRQALRDFKIMNGLPRDDLWDITTHRQLVSPSARKNSTTAPPAIDTKYSGSLYPPPYGATLNPLNPDHAAIIQGKLAELGLFSGQHDGVWGPMSRAALISFKSTNGLPSDDKWDSQTEIALRTAQRSPMTQTESYTGIWAGSAADCPTSTAVGDPLQITNRRAAIGENVCNFDIPQRDGQGWRTKATCQRPGKAPWSSNVRITVVDNHLTWSSENGATTFVRCR
jgi:peptidoglycan hydrolase-like protein with peptidoglycan-binding domain